MKNDFKAYLSAYHNEVTGSRLLLVIERPDGVVYRILVDCGYFQEIKYRYLNYVDDFDPSEIDAMIITHNHIDHTGLVPKAVRQGYNHKIYMTKITRELVKGFWKDCADQQEDNARYMRDLYPDEASKFKALYYEEDVDKADNLCVGINFRKTIEILPGVKLTFWENGHLLGAGMVLLQISYENRKDINFFFTGDYKPTNRFFTVPKFPKWLVDMPLIMVCESTYGTTYSWEIQKCFRDNMLEAFREKRNILIGVFAQGRMQDKLYDLKLMQEEGLIPSEYGIYMDGPLGIKTTGKYIDILEWFNPEMKDFLPEGIQFVDPKGRSSILTDGRPKIVLTTSGMLSNGPAREYVPLFLEHPNSMIHITGYAAEETLARKLLEAADEETITIGGHSYKKRAKIKMTSEDTSHAPADIIVGFINQFNHVELVAVNHGEAQTRKSFSETVVEDCPKVKDVGLIDREHMFCIYQFGYKEDKYTNMVIKQLPAKLVNNYNVVFGKENNKKSHKKTSKKIVRKSEKKGSQRGYNKKKHSRSH